MSRPVTGKREKYPLADGRLRDTVNRVPGERLAWGIVNEITV